MQEHMQGMRSVAHAEVSLLLGSSICLSVLTLRYSAQQMLL